jgi:hypothetical protein
MQISLSHFTFKKTSLLFFARCREQKKITSRAKVNALVYSMICGRLFRALPLTVMLQAPALNFMRRAKLSGGALSIKQMRQLLTPVACALSERSE